MQSSRRRSLGGCFPTLAMPKHPNAAASLCDDSESSPIANVRWQSRLVWRLERGSGRRLVYERGNGQGTHVSRLFTKLDGANRVQIQSSCTTVARLDALATCGTKGRATHRQGPSRRPYARGCAYACRGPHTPRPATAARGSQYEGRHPEATSSPGSIDWAHRAWATVISSRRLARSRSSMPACASTGRSCFGVTHRLALSCLDGDHGSGRNQPGGVRES